VACAVFGREKGSPQRGNIAMAIVDIARGQSVRIPALQLTHGREFVGILKASDGETLIVEVDEKSAGRLPDDIDDLLVITWVNEGIQRACPIIVRSHSERALVAQVVIQERREAPRMRVDVQLEYLSVPPSKVKDTAEEVMSRVNTTADPTSEALSYLNKGDDPLLALQGEVAQLREIIQQLVINIADLTAIVVGGTPAQMPANQPRSPLVILNCSSTGVGFITTEPLQEGDYLRLTLTLRTIPMTIIECMGVVVRCLALEQRESDGQGMRRYDIGVRYTHIHETDRERLIHYLFKVQRKLLRDLKEAREATGEQQKKSFLPVNV
jgi:hypothetical protein